MDKALRTSFDHLEQADKEAQYEAYLHIMETTKQEVDWAYEVWDKLTEMLIDPDAHRRSRAAQFLSHLAVSDPEERILDDFFKVWEVTYDKKFVTARHSLQTIWRIGLAGEKQKALVLSHLSDRFREADKEKNGTLIRSDILQGTRHLYEADKEEAVKLEALALIETEADGKQRKKYRKIWNV
ncbi:hypothetical protein [Alkalicoccus halolimnae]|uniref:HEAT repeat domain-containing protein n=1 Tax=Alkalicoccus halolimnae TaxID=1667239 RepID=A0A5C7F2W1_9BACI|nr:hypothetical protein [Alkalicoccus halolimnae]TXF84653.1 hypothetical protein FTX54_10660 [Alkalicoccus halolimnae]